MNNDQLLRYSRQILLPEIDLEGQERLGSARVLIIGVGGLGCPAAQYLAAAGVRQIDLVDDDRIELSNLQRQILFATAEIGEFKAEAAARRLGGLNPEVRLVAHTSRLEGEALRAAVRAADVVLDCSDNFTTRFAVNAACVASATPLVSGAAIRTEGQVTVIPQTADAPCYRCLFPEEGAGHEESCSETGVFTPLVGVIGALQAAEAMKLLLHLGTPLAGRLLHYDLTRAQFRELRFGRDPHCPVCGQLTGTLA